MDINITFITPTSAEELAPYEKDFKFLFNFIPQKYDWKVIWPWLLENEGCCTLAFANGLLIGCFIFEIYKRTVEIHGVARPDMNLIVPAYKRVKLFCYQTMLRAIFEDMGKEKVILKAPEDNLGVVGFARMFGFKRLPNLDKGEVVWKLERKDFINGKG